MTKRCDFGFADTKPKSAVVQVGIEDRFSGASTAYAAFRLGWLFSLLYSVFRLIPSCCAAAVLLPLNCSSVAWMVRHFDFRNDLPAAAIGMVAEGELPKSRGKITRRNGHSVSQDRCVFDHIGQFTDISRPRV